MNKYLVFFLLTSFQFVNLKSQSQKQYGELVGVLKKPSHKYIYLIWYDALGKREIDSSIIINGKFKFYKKINGFSDRFFLKNNREISKPFDSLNTLQIMLDNSLTKIELHDDKYYLHRIFYSKLLNTFQQISSKIVANNILADSLSKLLDSKKKSENANAYNLEKEISNVEYKNKRIVLSYLKKNPNSQLSPFYIYWWIHDAEMNDYYEILSKENKNSYYGNLIRKKINEFNSIKNQIGKPAPDFLIMKMNDSSIYLSSFRNTKYTILNFWGSWCGPCRKNHLKNHLFYDSLIEKGLMVIGISQETQETLPDWKRSIMEDSVSKWVHLTDRKNVFDMQEVPISVAYQIKYLPVSFLIDKSGVIIRRYESNDEIMINDLRVLFSKPEK